MLATRIALAAFLPATIVAARFVIPGLWQNDLTLFFASTGFVTTFLPCLVSAMALRRKLVRIPTVAVALSAAGVAILLLAVFPTMPSWPFAGAGFVVAWLLMSAAFSALMLLGLGIRYA